MDFFSQKQSAKNLMPGPGAYTPREGQIAMAGAHVSTKYKNEGNTKMKVGGGNWQNNAFGGLTTTLSQQRFPILVSKEMPSPGEYEVESITKLNRTGRYVNSKFKNSGASKFSGTMY